MKWSWKAFGLQLVVIFGAVPGLAYIASAIIDAQRGSEAPDSTLLSMRIAGFVAPMALSALAGWMGWNLKSSLVVAFIVAGIYGSQPIFGILCVIASVILYFSTRKLSQVLAFYTGSTSYEDPQDEDSTITKKTEQDAALRSQP